MKPSDVDLTRSFPPLVNTVTLERTSEAPIWLQELRAVGFDSRKWEIFDERTPIHPRRNFYKGRDDWFCIQGPRLLMISHDLSQLAACAKAPWLGKEALKMLEEMIAPPALVVAR